MIIKSDKAKYDIAINIAQIDIIGRCNINCIHCRGKDSKCAKVVDMTFEIIKKAIDFAVNNTDKMEDIVLKTI